MKTLFYCWCLSLFLPSLVNGQTVNEKLRPVLTPVGVYLNMNVFPVNGEIGVVERDKGDGFETIGTLSAPSTPAMLYQRMQNQSSRFTDRFMVSSQLANVLWQNMQAGKKESVLKEGIPVALLALGAAFLDTTANLPAQTRYRIQLGTQSWESLAIGNRTNVDAPNLITFQKLQPSAQAIRAEWRLKLDQQPKILTVQRKRLGIDSNFSTIKTDLGYEKTKQGDSLSVHLSDTTVLAGISYTYFLTGKDYLGRITTSSDTIRSIAGNKTTVNGINSFTTRTAADSSGIQLNWSLQDKYAIRSIRVLKSAYYDSTFVQVAVLAPTDTLWIDRSTATGANYYYQIIAQGDDDFAYPSPRIFGSFLNKQRLLPPTSLHAQKTDAGIKLTWKYPTYLNLLGFRMYRALGSNGKFIPISDVINASRDSLAFSHSDKDKSLVAGEFYTYAVAAIGRNNIESPLSSIAQINYAIKQRLAAPSQLRTMMLSDTVVSITWQNLSETGQNVAGYNIFRKAIGIDSVKGFVKLNTQPLMGTNEFTDTLAIGSAWQYVVQAVNQTDSSNFSLPVAVKIFGDKPLPPGNVQLFAQKNSVVINWDGTMVANVVKYNIYKATASTSPVKIGSVAVNAAKTFEDKNLSSGALFYYYITTETNKGQESEKSSETSIRLK